ncbi:MULTISPECIES: RNA polymerase sigma factor SigJ [Pseudonocardia]|nr:MULTISPECIES: RNA polymerase sigma factor SigJ [Pseudonocardia]
MNGAAGSENRATENRATEEFAEHRSLLFTVAYELLGDVGDAEDVVQDTWLKWVKVDHATIENPRAYLARIASRRALERLRSVRRAREDYVGSWLPEPLWPGPDPSETVLERDGIAVGMLVVLETLSPLERTAFVLHDVFGFSHAEIAETLQRSTAAVRQTVHRARGHVQARRPRFPVEDATADAAARQFLSAAADGDVTALLQVMAPDVVLHTDGGGRVPAALHPIRGADKIARLITHVWSGYEGLTAIWTTQGGVPTAALVEGDTARAVVAIECDPAGRVVALYANLNPDKIRHVGPGHGGDAR